MIVKRKDNIIICKIVLNKLTDNFGINNNKT